MNLFDKLLAATNEVEFFILASHLHFGAYGEAKLYSTGRANDPHLLVKLELSLSLPRPNGRNLLTRRNVGNFRLYPDQHLEWDILDYTYLDIYHPKDENILETIVGLEAIKVRLSQIQDKREWPLLEDGNP